VVTPTVAIKVIGTETKKNQSDDWFASRSSKKTDRKQVDGVSVYTEEELNIGKGKDTDLCPFDCDCCF